MNMKLKNYTTEELGAEWKRRNNLAKAEKLYNFIVGEQPKAVTKSIIKPDDIYFIFISQQCYS